MIRADSILRPMNKAMSHVPSVDQVLKQVDDLLRDHNHNYVVERVRLSLEELRDTLQQGVAMPSRAELLADAERKVRRRIELESRPNLRRVVNATGVILHTGLGRAPLPAVPTPPSIRAARRAGLPPPPPRTTYVTRPTVVPQCSKDGAASFWTGPVP